MTRWFPGRFVWPQVFVTKVVTHMAATCLSLGEGQIDICAIGSQPASQLMNCNWPANKPCDKISTCQALGWWDMLWQGGSDWHFVSLAVNQPASLPAWQLQLASQPAMWQDINLSGFGLVRHVVTGRVRLTFCVIGSQPASQLASLTATIGQPTSHVTRYQPVRLWVGQMDWEPYHIGLQSRIPALPLVPLGKWPTWPRPGKWHKWTL